jgi:hypothetical protein
MKVVNLIRIAKTPTTKSSWVNFYRFTVFLDRYIRINSTKSSASEAGRVSECRLMPQIRRERVNQCVSAIRVGKFPVLFAYIAPAIMWLR